MEERQAVLVVDADVVFLRSLLNAFRRFATEQQIPADIYGAATWPIAVSLLQQHRITAVLIDYHLDSESALDYIPKLKRLFHVPTIVVMSERGSFEDGAQAIIAGASACVVKRDIESIIRATYRHFRILRKQRDILTAREKETARYLAQGLSNKTIAKMMGVSVNTVHAHLRSLYSKLKVSSRLELIRAASEFLT